MIWQAHKYTNYVLKDSVADSMKRKSGHIMQTRAKRFLVFLIAAICLAHPWRVPAQQAADAIQPEGHMPLSEETGAKAASGRKWLIATANPHASEAGAAILRAGGNAIDAMVAVETTLGLTEPQSSGLGGGAFLVYWDNKNKRLFTYDGRETAPAAITPEIFLDEAGKPLKFFDAVVSGLSVGVPGVPRLLYETHRLHGSKPWAGLMDRAISLSENGFEVSQRLAGLVERQEKSLKRFDATRNLFFDAEGKPLQAGAVMKNPDYAATLRAFQAGGADAFYKGPVAEKIVEAVQNAQGRKGSLSLEDLARYRIKERDPVCTPYRAYTVCGMGPPSSGGIAVGQILGILEAFDLSALGAASAESWQLIADATRLAFADRGRYVADEDFLPVPVKGLLRKDYLTARAGLLSPGKKLDVATPGTPAFDHALNYGDGQSFEIPSTTHFVIRDAGGNIVSMTASIESAFGSNITAAGILLNNQLTDFSFETHDNGALIANAAAPGKRPRSSMSPTIIFKDGVPAIALGSPGGSRIISYIAKTIVATIDWGMSIQAAIDLPHMTNRFGTYALEANTMAVDFQPALEAMGYDTVVIPLNSGIQGLVIEDGLIEGAADSRREGTVIAE